MDRAAAAAAADGEMNIDFIPLKSDSRPGSRSGSSKPSAAVFRAPRALLCHICGRQTLIAGYEHHIKQCAALFEKRQALLPPKERRMLPPRPEALGRGGGLTMQEHNEMAMRAMASTMAECEHCGRTFLPEKLAIHHKSCSASTPARRVGQVGQIRSGGSTLSPGDLRRDEIVFSSSSSATFGSRATMPSLSSQRKPFATAAPPMLPAEMQQCAHCGRSFNEIAYAKHSKICLKVFVKKRKPFDAAKHRLQDLIPDARASKKISSNHRSSAGRSATRSVAQRPADTSQQQQQPGPSTRPDWRAQSESFRQAMKLARVVRKAEEYSSKTGIPLRDIIPLHNSQQDPVYDSYITCPTCSRRFSEQAGSRHIPQCRGIVAKPSRLLAHSGQVATKYSYTDAVAARSPRQAPPSTKPGSAATRSRRGVSLR